MFLLALFFAAALSATTPVWPDKYYMTGDFLVLEANLTMPFIVNWDEPNHRENLMYYNSSMDYTIWDNDAYYYIHVVKDHQECIVAPNVIAEVLPLSSLLPDMSEFTYDSQTTVRGITVEKWVWEDPEGEEGTNCYRDNLYAMFVDAKTQYPVRFDIHGYNVIYDSHYDIYRFEYYNFTEDYNERTAYEPPSICDNPTVPSQSTFDRHATLFSSLMHPGNSFEKFVDEYGRKYKDESEREFRKRIFDENMRKINEINASQKSWTAAPNRFADMTHEEIIATMTGRIADAERPIPPHFTAAPSQEEEDELPTALDWRVRDGVSGRVKDQCSCGSCWVFGAIGSAEGRYAVANDLTQHVYFSEQFVVDCFWDDYDSGCNGGNSPNALAWLAENMTGIPLESDYQYLSLDSWCHEELQDSTYKPTSWGAVERGSVSGLKVALQDGPVAVGIAVPETMVWYSSGIYTDPDCGSAYNDIVHDVTAEGYAVDTDGTEYWIIKNSWSSQWGNDGYIYIATENNLCGVATDTGYAVY